MKGRLTSVDCAVDSSIFAFSAASFRRCSASLSPRRSMPSSFLKPSARYSTILLSKSSPPRQVAPLVDFTSNTQSPTSKIGKAASRERREQERLYRVGGGPIKKKK